ncbi:hypothetical protein QZH41_001693 [Actinostola sp. cb2023]|nr:hypothetical protein QZH41_001693 [Actinostola sp. cb2023]
MASKSSESSSPEESSSATSKRVYEKWTNDEQKILVNLWAENFERIESKDSRKVWDSIAEQINKKFKASRSRRTTDKFQKKIKYLVDRYKQAKDWNVKQSGGHRRKSIFYDEVDEVLGCRDIVTLQHVGEAGSSSSTASSNSTNPSSPSHSDEDEIAQATNKAGGKRSERKRRRKQVAKEEEDEEEQKLLRIQKQSVTSILL